MSSIVWLASYPRSGNTWLRVLIHNLFNAMADAGPQDINRLNERSAWDIASNWYDDEISRAPQAVVVSAIAAARAKAHAAIARDASGIVFVKTHSALVRDFGFPTISLELTAGAIYAVRNPLDVAISLAHHVDLSLDRAIAVMSQPGYRAPSTMDTVAELYGSWNENVRSWTDQDHPRFLVTRYEDMVEKCATEIGRIVRHLKIEASMRDIATAIEWSSFSRLKKTEEQVGYAERPKTSKRFFREGSIGQWKTILSTRQIRAICEQHQAMMERFGYFPI